MAQTYWYISYASLYNDLGLSSGQCRAMDRITACLFPNHPLSILRNNMDIPIKTNIILDGAWALAQKVNRFYMIVEIFM